jgi:predicted SprT family Zn-dependent metalloprotease
MRAAFKQLEFLFAGQAHRLPFEGGTQKPARLAPPGALAGLARGDDRGRRSAPTLPNSGSSSERPIRLRGRDRVLESHARELLHGLGADKLAREIRVEWNPRLKTCAGRADFRERLVSLNPCLLDLNDRPVQTQPGGEDLECNKHSRFPNASGTGALNSHLECKMHSRSARAPQKLDCDSGVSARHQLVRDEIDRTLRHELAHLLAQWRVGRRRIAPHGEEWRQACRDLGIADEARCHNLPFATETYARRYIYRCPNCKAEFPRVRRIRRAMACLACCRIHNGGDFDPRFRLKLSRKL